MAITRHIHTNETGHQHVFQVDTDRGTVHLVKPNGSLQLSSTNPAPILALPKVDEDKQLEPLPQPELAQPAAIAPEAPKPRKLKAVSDA